MGHQGMKYSLVTRELIADSTEAMVMAHQFDALVMVPNCDKNVPGLLMAAARLNLPTIFISGGPMPSGKACRNEDHGAVPGRGSGQGYYDEGGIFKCVGGGYGAGLFYQQYASSSGNRP